MVKSKTSSLLHLAFGVYAASNGPFSSAACTPTWILDRVTEDGFNVANTPFIIRPSCNTLDTESHAVFITSAQNTSPSLGLGHPLENTTITPYGISVPGLSSGAHSLIVVGRDNQQHHIFGSFPLLFGSIHLPVRVVDGQGKPLSGVSVKARAYPGFTQHGLTDSSGNVGFDNLPEADIELSASTLGHRTTTVRTAARRGSDTFVLNLSGPDSDLDAFRNQQASLLVTETRARHHRRQDNCPMGASRPICQPSCQDPPPHSCDFYERCAEETLHCGSGGYPLHYGAKNCRRFVSRLQSFSAKGQAWIWNTMSCLQKALVGPIEESRATCDSVKKAAFRSHPICYIDNGFCELPSSDLLQVVITVKTDLLTGSALDQVLTTAKGCLRRRLFRTRDNTRGLASSPGHLDETAIMEELERYLQTFGSPDFV